MKKSNSSCLIFLLVWVFASGACFEIFANVHFPLYAWVGAIIFAIFISNLSSDEEDKKQAEK